MRLPKFSHKTPGFGITRNTYITVLAAQASLPSPVQIASPKPSNGAIQGFCVPLQGGSSPEVLGQPLMRGAYAVSTMDRKTLMRMLVLSKEEAGFEPGPFLRSKLAIGRDPDLLARISATWTLMQLTFESHDPMVYSSVRFMLEICARLADLTGGVVADPITRTYLLPHQVFHSPQADPKIDARDVVQVLAEPNPEGNHVYTLGMMKFGLAEIECYQVSDGAVVPVRSFLISACQKALLGQLYQLGDKVGNPKLPLLFAPGGLDRGKWEGIPCFELIPPPSKTIEDCIAAWKS